MGVQWSWGAGDRKGRPYEVRCVGADDPVRPMRCKEESPVTASPRQSPFRQGGQGDGGMRIATAGARTGFAMTGFLQGVRYKSGRVVREADPYAPLIDRTSGAASSTPRLQSSPHICVGAACPHTAVFSRKTNKLPSCKDTKITYPCHGHKITQTGSRQLPHGAASLIASLLGYFFP